MSTLRTNTISTVSGTVIEVDGWLSVSSGTTLNSTLRCGAMNANGSFVVSGAANFNGNLTVTGLSAASITTGTIQTSCTATPTLANHLTRKDYVDSQLIGLTGKWQNLTGSRAATTQYTNSTGGPIMVVAIGTCVATTAVIVNGTTILTNTNSNANQAFSVSFIVPNGHTYQYNTSAIKHWAELR